MSRELRKEIFQRFILPILLVVIFFASGNRIFFYALIAAIVVVGCIGITIGLRELFRSQSHHP